MKMTLAEFEKMCGIERNVPPAPTRADIDRMRRKKLSKPWRGVRAQRRR